MKTKSFAPHAPCLAAVVLLAAAVAGCGDGGGSPSPVAPKAAVKTEWSPDEMSSDPEGYLRWAIDRLDQQRKVREERISKIAVRRKEIVAKRAAYATNVDDCDNIVKRMRTAIRRAEDEDRWPVSLGGRTFERDKAEQVIQACEKRVAERKPMVQVYDDALAKLDATSAAFRAELQTLGEVRSKTELDLERVRLSQGVAELAQLKKTEAEIAHYAKILGAVADDVTGAAAGLPSEPPPVDLDSLIK